MVENGTGALRTIGAFRKVHCVYECVLTCCTPNGPLREKCTRAGCVCVCVCVALLTCKVVQRRSFLCALTFVTEGTTFLTQRQSKFVRIYSICISVCRRPTLSKIPHSLSSCHLFLCCVPFPESCLGAKQQLFSQLVANWICLLFWAKPAAHNGLLELLTATCFSRHPQEWWAGKTVKTRIIKWKQKGAKTLQDKD